MEQNINYAIGEFVRYKNILFVYLIIMRKMNVRSLLCCAFVIFIVFLLVRYFRSFREGYTECEQVSQNQCNTTPIPGTWGANPQPYCQFYNNKCNSFPQ
jgi:hypothetical protein